LPGIVAYLVGWILMPLGPRFAAPAAAAHPAAPGSGSS
jgi:hypothetical protein